MGTPKWDYDGMACRPAPRWRPCVVGREEACYLRPHLIEERTHVIVDWVVGAIVILEVPDVGGQGGAGRCRPQTE